jgi:cell division protein ZapA (FtsZ GTPase activity inhibitor)
MTIYQWVMLGLGALGFIGTWILGAFKLGRAVEQMQGAVRKEIKDEREFIISKIEQLEEKFEADQRSQDHNFGEVNAAMRQYTADVEKKLREVEIYGRDNYVKIPDFEKAIDRMGETFKTAVTELKEDMRRILRAPPH